MAGTCIVCNSSLESSRSALSSQAAFRNDNPSSNANGFESQPFLCHRYCTVCSACSSAVGEKFATACTTHCENSQYDGELIGALKHFKVRSLSLKSALEDETAVSLNDFQEQLSKYVCTCSDPKYVQLHMLPGYRVECVEKCCPKREIFTKHHENRFKSYSDLGSTRASGHKAATVAPEEFYRYFFYGVKHWNYCTKDEDVGAIVITLKPEIASPHSKGSFR